MPSFSEAVTNDRMACIDEYIINKTSLIQIRTSSAWNSNCITYRCARARHCFDFSPIVLERKICSYYLGVFFLRPRSKINRRVPIALCCPCAFRSWSRSEVARRIPLATRKTRRRRRASARIA
ncbi:unnamed protein product [Trichogramma brassicae]|uniref:Uncharacterized protein n=1 Tax=Trichogramma brassicae TaxID=86971 RepID=A0A6H5IB16_9HYME|nr:unnamed protein product [Trichogramma brassicae]